jgi:hypothetical protein
MIQIRMTLESISVSARMEDSSETARWVGESLDEHTTQRVAFKLTSDQLAALAWLAIAGDDTSDSETLARMTKIAEETTAGWPIECRPMP